jgi:hypothetical protein
MLSLAQVPTEQEKQAIDDWQSIIRTFRPRVRGVIQQYYPWAVPISEIRHAANLSLAAELYAGKNTYGEYNNRRLELVSKFIEAMQQREIEVRRDQMRAAQVAAQQSMAVSAAFSNFQTYLSNQQLINQQLQPTRIAPFTCTRFGNTTNCY